MKIDIVAREIAKDLFTDGSQRLADRLVLFVDSPQGGQLGGWSESAAVERIKKILAAHADHEK